MKCVTRPELADLASAPSLVVYNDAAFAEKDFQSLISLGDSRKRSDVRPRKWSPGAHGIMDPHGAVEKGHQNG